jgi:DNA-binding TFAR19-related protein (PDSD5 family)
MTPEAKERCNYLTNNLFLVNRLSLVKPDKAQKIEDMILQVKI